MLVVLPELLLSRIHLYATLERIEAGGVCPRDAAGRESTNTKLLCTLGAKGLADEMEREPPHPHPRNAFDVGFSFHSWEHPPARRQT